MPSPVHPGGAPPGPAPHLAPRPIALVASGIAAALAACASPGPPLPSTAPLDDDGCPLPIVFGPGATRPVRVRLENRTADTLDVFLDRCFHHTHLAAVPPGRIRQPELPRRLVAFPEGYRFHAFGRKERRFEGTYVAPAEERAVLQVVLDAAARLGPGELAPMALRGPQGQEGDFSTILEADASYASTFSTTTSGFLTWSCGEAGRRYLTLSLGRRVEGRVTARARSDGSPWSDLGRWEVADAYTDAAVVEGEARDALTALALRGARLDVVLEDEAGSRQAHVFGVEGLAAALRGMTCWAAAAPLPD